MYHAIITQLKIYIYELDIERSYRNTATSGKLHIKLYIAAGN